MYLNEDTRIIVEDAENLAAGMGSKEVNFCHLEQSIMEVDFISKRLTEIFGAEKITELNNLIHEKINQMSRMDLALTVAAEKSKITLIPQYSKDLREVLQFCLEKGREIYGREVLSTALLFGALISYKSDEGCMADFFKQDERLLSLMEELANEERVIAECNAIGNVSAKNWKDYAIDLVEKAKEYDKPFIGREDLIETTIRILARKEKCNPVHVGEPGVGKTAITYGLAKRIADGDVPEKLKGSHLYSIDLAGMIAGSKYRGEFEERLKTVLREVSKEEKPILFFDEIHTIVGAGAAGGGAMDASNILKPYLTEGKIKFIGATTNNEYRTYIEKDKALERRFQKVTVEEPSEEDTIKIISGLKEGYETYHNVKYTKDAISTAVKLSRKYIHDRYLPDKAIDLIDETGAEFSIHPEKGKWIKGKDIEQTMVKVCKIVQIEADKTEMKTLRMLDTNLKKVVFGQNEAIKEVCDAIKLSKTGLGDKEKPIASLLFVGKSGTGKTELAKQLANVLKIDFVRFDMSEYQEKHSISKLIGAPSGYVGYEDGGLLTETIRQKPHCVLLFDEIEKAHEDIYKTFLQIMDYGTLTDNKGRKADFRNAIIIMTSNAGAHVASKHPIGINSTKTTVNTDGILDAVKETFSPEFRNRLTKTIIFNGIDENIGRMIVIKELNKLADVLKEKKVTAKFTAETIDELVRIGLSEEYGAREIQRAINEHIRTLFVEALLEEKPLTHVTVDYKKEFVLE